MLEIKNVSIRYQSHLVVQDVSLNLVPGKIMALIGPNGSGKTTLIRGVTGVIPLAAGSIEFSGEDLTPLSESARAKIISVVPQILRLPAGFTVFDTVAFGRTPHIDWLGRLTEKDHHLIETAIQNTSVGSFRDSDVQNLSGGEQQRVILARALAQNTPVMILDEPTSHLDLTYQVGLLTTIQRLCRENKIAMLVVLHDLNLAARFSDEIAILDHGKIAISGFPQEVLTEENLSAVYHLPMRILWPNDNSYPVIIPK